MFLFCSLSLFMIFYFCVWLSESNGGTTAKRNRSFFFVCPKTHFAFAVVCESVSMLSAGCVCVCMFCEFLAIWLMIFCKFWLLFFSHWQKIKRSEKWKRWNDGILIEKWLWNVVSLHSTADGIFAQCRVKIVKHKSGTMVDCCILHRVIYSAFVILHKAKINSFTMESEEFHSAKAFDVKSFSEKKLFLN